VVQTTGGSIYFALFFTVGNDLWRCWGTSANTNLIKSFASPPSNLIAVGNMIYFAADDGTGSGVELWKSDGWSFTTLAKDINPGTGSSSPTNLTKVGGTVYFSADDGTHGRELWRTDSSAGAVLTSDINPEAASSNPSNIINFDGTAVFTADDGTNGVELWQSDGFPTPDHLGMCYKWDLSSLIQSKGNPSKIAVAATDTDPFSIYWLFDFPVIGGGEDLSEAAHQVNTYVEITDGTDRAPLIVTNVDCGDGNLTRPKAALTDGSDHNAIAFGMVAVLDQDPCDTDACGPGSPSVPFAYVPAVYDGHDWIPMDLTHIPAGVPSNPPSGESLAQGPFDYLARDATLPAGLEAATLDPWTEKRFTHVRIDVWDEYVRAIWSAKNTEYVWVATIERQYKGAFKSLYLGNQACLQPTYWHFIDTMQLNGGVFTDDVVEHGACCQTNGTCVDVDSAAECADGKYTPWLSCSDPGLPLCCPTPWADADADTDVDQVDFGMWQACFSGNGKDHPDRKECKCFDRIDDTGAQGGDGDIDITDFDWFASCYTGPAVPMNIDSPPTGCTP